MAPSASVLVWAILAAVVAAVGLGVLLWGLAYRRLTYALGEQSLDITWFGQTLVVPYASIEGIYTGQRLVGSAVPRVPAWPGIYVGPGRARGVGRLRFFTTSPDPAALTLIAGDMGAVVVSARDPLAFRTALIERVESLPHDAEPLPWRTQRAASAPWSAVRDRWLAVCVGSGIVVLLLTLTAIVFGFGALPAEIPMRFDASGQPTQVAPAEDLLRLPLLAVVLAAVNVGLGVWLHTRERLLARLLWIGAVVIQAIVFVSVVRLLQ